MLRNVVAIVSGGSSGLGAATASYIVRNGGRVVVADLPSSKDHFLRLAAASCAEVHLPIHSNITSTDNRNEVDDITEEITTTTYGAALNKWSGDNITHSSASSGGIVDSDSIFNMTTAGSDFSLEVVTRAASQVIELTEIERTIETESTTVSLSVFSQ